MHSVIISQRIYENQDYPETRFALDIAWAELFQALDCIPVPVATQGSISELFDHVQPDAVILSGGNDVVSVSNTNADALRESIDRDILKIAIDRAIPTLAVCRAAQMLATDLGYSLEAISNHVRVEHELTWQKSPRVGASSGRLPTLVNSFHNLGVTGASTSATTLAHAPDGSIEAFEHNDSPITAIMWHPEREPKAGSEELQFYRALLNL